MDPPHGGRCITCGRELGADPHMITSPPTGEHVACRDWSRHPYPHAHLLERVRGRARAVRRALAALEAMERWLEQRQRIWPASAAETVLELEPRRRKLSDLLERAGFRRMG